MSTANRLLNILSLFTIERPQWTVEAAAAELGLTLSTAYRYFKSLVEAGLVTADVPGRYTLGPAIIQFDRQMRVADPLIATAAPVMRKLAMAMGADAIVLLCRLYRTKVLCVHHESLDPTDFHGRNERGQPISYERGQPMPLHRGAPSKAILAHMNLRTVRPIYESDPAAMREIGLGADWSEVRRTLRALRSGPIITHGEMRGGMQGVALPIIPPETSVIGSLSIVAPADRWNMPLDAVGATLHAAVRDIQERLAPSREQPAGTPLRGVSLPPAAHEAEARP